MKETRKILNSFSELKEEYQFYERLLDKIDRNIELYPDISIETCKTFIEGISKSIILALDKGANINIIQKSRVDNLYKQAIRRLEISDNFEASFMSCIEVNIKELREIRNKRGEISHGHEVPKEKSSDQGFAVLVVKFTDALAVYMLEHFYKIISRISEDKLIYEKLEDFNIFLDESQPDFPIANTPYSKVLYEYDYIMYEAIYDEYLENK